MYERPPQEQQFQPESIYVPPLEESQQQQPIKLDFIRSNVIICWVLLIINVLVYGYTLLQGFSLMGNGDLDGLILINLGAKFSPFMDIRNEWWRLLTPMVLHGGLIHLAFNTYALYILGPEVERLFGSLRFFIIYLIAGLVGSIASYMFGSLEAPAIGASGAIFGLMGAIAGFSYQARNTLGEMARKNLQRVMGLAVINLVIGFSLAGIDNYAHMGGLLAGGLVGILLAPRLALMSDPYNPRIIGRANNIFGWIGSLLIITVALGAMWFVHLKRLDDPKIRTEFEQIVQEIDAFNLIQQR